MVVPSRDLVLWWATKPRNVERSCWHGSTSGFLGEPRDLALWRATKPRNSGVRKVLHSFLNLPAIFCESKNVAFIREPALKKTFSLGFYK